MLILWNYLGSIPSYPMFNKTWKGLVLVIWLSEFTGEAMLAKNLHGGNVFVY